MKPDSKLQIAGLIVRVSLGAWFISSGGDKLFRTGLNQFVQDIGNYKMVHAPWDAVIAYSLPWIELLGGVCLMLGILRKGTLLAMTGLVGVFSVAIGWALYHHLDISCGCHGGDTKVSWLKVPEFALYYASFGFLWWLESRMPQGSDHAIPSGEVGL